MTSVRAIDRDMGMNAVIQYSLSGEDSVDFEVNRTTGHIKIRQTLQKLNYFFTVRAVDGGMPPMSNKADIFLNFRERPDGPKFSLPSYNFSLSENKPRGTIIENVEATASDSQNVYYTINQSNVPFSVGRTTGIIRSTLIFDREIADRYMFEVKATAGNYSSVVGVRVKVTDVNDNPPRFTQSVYRVRHKNVYSYFGNFH